MITVAVVSDVFNIVVGRVRVSMQATSSGINPGGAKNKAGRRRLTNQAQWQRVVMYFTLTATNVTVVSRGFPLSTAAEN